MTCLPQQAHLLLENEEQYAGPELGHIPACNSTVKDQLQAYANVLGPPGSGNRAICELLSMP